MVVTPTTRQELRRAVNATYDAYLATLDRELKARGYDGLHGVAAAHKLLGQVATDAYSASLRAKAEVQDAYGRYVDAPSMVSQAKAACARKIQNAESRLVAAKAHCDALQDHVNKIASGEFAKFGITEPDASETKRLVDLVSAVLEAQSALANVRAMAEADLIDTLEKLELVRPGVTGDHVKHEVAVSRDVCIALTLQNWDGPVRWRDGLPRRRAVARLSGIRAVTMDEIRRLAP